MDARTRLAARTGNRVAYLRELLRSQDSPCGECGGRQAELNEINRGLDEVLPEPEPRRSLCCPSCAGTGLTLRPRVELAAYCGDEASRHAGGLEGWATPNINPTERPFSEWLAGLSRWGPRVLVRAAIAAARVALRFLPCGGSPHRQQGKAGRWYRKVGIEPCGAGEWEPCECDEARRAIEAAEAWVECPCEEHLLAWWEAVPQPPLTWVPVPLDTELGHLAIQGAAQLAGEAPVRSAIQRALISWALGGLP